MCTITDERTVMVCDVAIGQVREHLQEAFGEALQYITVEGYGAQAEVSSTVNIAQFQAVTREAIAETQTRGATLRITHE